jgi:hypothetical protein
MLMVTITHNKILEGHARLDQGQGILSKPL